MTSERRALIVGAGTAGLTAHLALRQRGWHVQHVERKGVDRAAGGSYMIWPNASKVLRELGVWDVLRERSTRVYRYLTFRADGELVNTVDFQAMSPDPEMSVQMITRWNLQRTLSDAVGDHVELERTFLSVVDEREPTVLLDGDDVRSADLVVAADGARSELREFIAGKHEPRFDGIRYWTGWFYDPDFLPKYSPEAESYLEYARDGRRILVFPCGPGMTGFSFISRVEDDGDMGDHYDWLVREYGDFPLVIQKLLERIKSERITPWVVRDLDQLPTWNRGGFVLIGDAAHAAAPTLGQGANMAIEDGWVLAESLADETDVEQGLHRFHERRADRTDFVVRESRSRAKLATSGAALTGENHPVWAGMKEFFAAGPIKPSA